MLKRNGSYGFTAVEALIVIVVLLMLLLATCSVAKRGPKEAVEVLETNGFSNVLVVDKTYFAPMYGCGRDDIIAYRCDATNALGKRVRVTVCTGFIKGGTVRVGGGMTP